MHPLEFHNGTDVERTAPVQAAALLRLSWLRHPTTLLLFFLYHRYPGSQGILEKIDNY